MREAGPSISCCRCKQKGHTFRSCKRGVAATDDDMMVLSLFLTNSATGGVDGSDTEIEEDPTEVENEDETADISGDTEEDEEEEDGHGIGWEEILDRDEFFLPYEPTEVLGDGEHEAADRDADTEADDENNLDTDTEEEEDSNSDIDTEEEKEESDKEDKIDSD